MLPSVFRSKFELFFHFAMPEAHEFPEGEPEAKRVKLDVEDNPKEECDMGKLRKRKVALLLVYSGYQLSNSIIRRPQLRVFWNASPEESRRCKDYREGFAQGIRRVWSGQ